jgi:hypothetical protein
VQKSLVLEFQVSRLFGSLVQIRPLVEQLLRLAEFRRLYASLVKDVELALLSLYLILQLALVQSP